MALSKEKQKALDETLNKINKKFNSKVISTAKEIEEKLIIKRLPTPSFEFNSMLHGGLVFGKITEFFGNSGSGKTMMTLEIIAKAQRENPNLIAGWLETESSLDVEFLEQFGIDTDRLVVIEQSEDFPAEKCMDVLRGMASSGQFDILVLNSVAALLPTKEVTDDMEKANIALVSKLLSKFFRVITASLSDNNTALILINQMRTAGIGSYVTYQASTGK